MEEARAAACPRRSLVAVLFAGRLGYFLTSSFTLPTSIPAPQFLRMSHNPFHPAQRSTNSNRRSQGPPPPPDPRTDPELTVADYPEFVTVEGPASQVALAAVIQKTYMQRRAALLDTLPAAVGEKRVVFTGLVGLNMLHRFCGDLVPLSLATKEVLTKVGMPGRVSVSLFAVMRRKRNFSTVGINGQLYRQPLRFCMTPAMDGVPSETRKSLQRHLEAAFSWEGDEGLRAGVNRNISREVNTFPPDDPAKKGYIRYFTDDRSFLAFAQGRCILLPRCAGAESPGKWM